MKLYVDRQNLINLFTQKHPLRDDALRTVQRQLDVHFNFSKAEAYADETLSMLLPAFNEGLAEGVTHEFEAEGYIPFELKSNVHTTHPDRHAVFLSENNSKAALCQQKRGFLVFGPGQEFDLFRELFLGRSDYDFDKRLGIGSAEFSAWPHLAPYALPFTDFILIDNYLYDDASLIPSNLHPFLDELHRRKQLDTNLVFFTDRDRFTTGQEAGFMATIRQRVQAVTGIRPNLTLVFWRQRRGVDNFAEHDRTLVTNYLRMYSGDTFNYFDSTGHTITHGRELTISSLAKRENFTLARKLIADLNTYLAWCRTHNPGNIHGDKKSTLLTF